MHVNVEGEQCDQFWILSKDLGYKLLKHFEALLSKNFAVAAFWVALATAIKKKLPPATISAFHELARTDMHIHVFMCSCSWT